MLNYVFFIGNEIVRDNYYGELIGLKNVRFVYKSSPTENKILNILFRISFSQKINRILKVPFKYKLFEMIVKKQIFEKNYPMVYIFASGWYDKKILGWLQKKHPEIYRTIYFDDTINFNMQHINDFNPNTLLKEFDCVFCYDPVEAQKYNFIHIDAFLSKKTKIDLGNCMKSDIVFIGKAKERLPLIKQVYNKLEKRFKCDFIIIDSYENLKRDKGIKYVQGNIPYMEYLKHENSSNCILEVLKSDANGQTLRCWEAVYYNKKLLTNWKGIFNFKYYNPHFMSYFSSVDDIDLKFLASQETVNYEYAGENSPLVFLNTIEKIWQRQRGERVK